MNITVSKGELWQMLSKRGYKIHFQEDIQTATIKVAFTGAHSNDSYILPRSYNPQYTLQEITIDVVEVLLKWSGLKLKATLDY